MTAWVILRGTSCQRWFEAPRDAKVVLQDGRSVKLRVARTDSLLGRARAALLGADRNCTVITDADGTVLFATKLLFAEEIVQLVEHVEANDSWIPELERDARARPRDAEAQWRLYHAKLALRGPRALATLVEHLQGIEGALDSELAETSAVMSCYTMIQSSDVAGLRKARRNLEAVAESVKTPAGLRALADASIPIDLRLQNMSEVARWSEMRWANRQPWESRSIARRLLSDVERVGEEKYVEDFLDELRDAGRTSPAAGSEADAESNSADRAGGNG